MANRDIFSKHLPNIKLATRFDADGNEIQVERREDQEQNAKEQEIFDILVAAGYFRARIKGLSAFDKIVGGMTWCIESCDFDVNVDLLFHENLTIGQKIALTEKIVTVLPKMKCPYLIEPHQIQGLDFISIYPVIQWLVKRSVENRTEKAERLKNFAVNQFHNYLQFKVDKENCEKVKNAYENVKKIQEIYSPKRQYKRKEAGNEDEKTRVRITLLEYGNKGAAFNFGSPMIVKNPSLKSSDDSSGGGELDDELILEKEIDVEQLLKNLYVAKEDDTPLQLALTDSERTTIKKHYADLKHEMEIDTKQLSEQSQIKALETTKAALEKKLLRVRVENDELEEERRKVQKRIDDQMDMEEKLKIEIKEFEKSEAKSDKKVLDRIYQLVNENEELKKEEVKYKEHCRQELARLQQEIKETEELSSENGFVDSKEVLDNEKEKLQHLRLQLAKKNRAIMSIQRQLDNIPDRTELAQYQRRFLELYNQVSAKHRETKQFYTLYNTLDDTKLYLEKELSLLNSIYENYNEGMTNQQSRDQFIKQFETIVDGVKQTQAKVKKKCDDEKAKRDSLNAQLMCLIEQQRKYAGAVKQLTKECQKNEALLLHLKSIQ
ncbi:coiled-coil domain-containing protein 93 [Condylostylus longicornis]|uniref:coiled-coil domain-containing protein 93 n=1 Tax=Condylostylus longicornis TaxID=2530218 RepID=UPI00244DBDB7|nr:coiled-coil domain-containing protein 93 [Condylostylus longicornis]